MKVLIVDDDDDTRSIARMSLEILGGLTVVDAANGNAGVALAKSSRPNLILLDQEMPEMNGLATISALRSNEVTGKIPVILLVHQATPIEEAAWKKSGAIDVVYKPFDPTQLALKVRGILDQAKR
jgi:two-component system, OmpR family, response regulator